MFWGAKINGLGSKMMKNEIWVSFGVPDGSQISLTQCVESVLGDFGVILEPQSRPKSIQKRCQKISECLATPSNKILHGEFRNDESEETTHFSVLDNHGNSVSVTTTLNTNYGSKVFVDEYGFLLNNEMDDFSSKPGIPNTYGLIGSQANSIEPGKRMLSSMTPSIIEKKGNIHLVVGTPGGSTIITSVFQTLLNVILFNMDIVSAVNSPRFHHQWKPEYIYMEEELYSKSLEDSLLYIGHAIKYRSSIGHVNAIMYNDNTVTVAADKRGDNSAQLFR